jgi:uncharacterized protein (TIGR00251 family)
MGTGVGRDSRTHPGGRPAWCRSVAGGVELLLHVQPAARREAIVGEHGDRLKVAVTAPPADGRANAAVLRLLAEALALPRATLQLAAGASGRDKCVRIESGDPALAEQICADLLRACARGAPRK